MTCFNCGMEIDDNAEICDACGTMLIKPAVTFIGRDLADGISFTVPKDGCVIGRESGFEIENLYSNNEWSRDISREHCKISFQGAVCQITHLGRSNPTYWLSQMGYIKMPRGKASSLKDGDTVAFGNEGISFTVNYKYPEAEKKPKEPKTMAVSRGWFIVCPKCRHEYPVPDINNWQPIQSCVKCPLSKNKKDIRYEEPRELFEEISGQ